MNRLVQNGFLAAERVVLESMVVLRDDIYHLISGLEALAHEALGDGTTAQAHIVYVRPKGDRTIGEMAMRDIPTPETLMA